MEASSSTGRETHWLWEVLWKIFAIVWLQGQILGEQERVLDQTSADMAKDTERAATSVDERIRNLRRCSWLLQRAAAKGRHIFLTAKWHVLHLEFGDRGKCQKPPTVKASKPTVSQTVDFEGLRAHEQIKPWIASEQFGRAITVGKAESNVLRQRFVKTPVDEYATFISVRNIVFNQQHQIDNKREPEMQCAHGNPNGAVRLLSEASEIIRMEKR